jgi:hypothetical protein
VKYVITAVMEIPVRPRSIGETADQAEDALMAGCMEFGAREVRVISITELDDEQTANISG